MTPPLEPPRLPEIPRDMVRFGDYGQIVLPAEGGGSPVVMGGIDAFGGGVAGLADIGANAPVLGNPLFQPVSPANDSVDISSDITRPDLGGMIPGLMRLVGLGVDASPTLVMPRDQLNELLGQIGHREVLVDPDATGPVDMTALPEELPLAARSSPLVRVSVGARSTPSFSEIMDVVESANRIMHATGMTMPAGQAGPPPPAASWYTALTMSGRRILASPDSPFRRLSVEALAATDPQMSGNILEITGSIQRTLARLGSHEELSAPDRQRLERQLADDVATLRGLNASVNRWQTYFEERSAVDHTMDHTLASFASPFGQDFVRFNLERRVSQGRRSGESWEDAFVRVSGGSEMFPASPFPSRVTEVAEFVSPSNGSDLADPWAPAQHGIRLTVDGDPEAFARFVVDTVNQGGQNVMVGPVYTTQILEAIQHEPGGFRFVDVEATVEDVGTPAALHAWETSHARIDPANPNRVIVTQSVPVRAADGSIVLNLSDGRPATREVTFFLEVNGS